MSNYLLHLCINRVAIIDKIELLFTLIDTRNNNCINLKSTLN